MTVEQQYAAIHQHAAAHGLTHERRKDYEHKRDALKENGYRLGLAATLLADTMQPHMADNQGLWAIDDPNDDEDGFCLRGDDLFVLTDEAHAARIAWDQ